jgi:hypothetical protein
MSLLSRIAKKLSRRTRHKGIDVEWMGSRGSNAAKQLVANNWNISNKSPKPERNGVFRAKARLTAKRHENAKIKYPDVEPSRQVLRRRALKATI